MADSFSLFGNRHVILTVFTVQFMRSRITPDIQEKFGNAMKASGHKITNRYSPGYCGWKTSEQFMLFRIFPENFCGVRLTESALMKPIKSISGVIGIGSHVEYHEYHCDLCDAVNCMYRNKK